MEEIEKEILDVQNYIKLTREKYLQLVHYLNGITGIHKTEGFGSTIYEINGSEILFTPFDTNGVMHGFIPKQIKLSGNSETDAKLKQDIKSIIKEK